MEAFNTQRSASIEFCGGFSATAAEAVAAAETIEPPPLPRQPILMSRLRQKVCQPLL